MTTLATCIPATGEEPAVIVPGSPALSITYSELHGHIKSFQQKLAELGVKDLTPVSIALPNSFAFIVSFLATTWQRGIAAPLNPAYKQGEFEFFLSDVDTGLLLVPQGAWAKSSQAVLAAKGKSIPVAECYWDSSSSSVCLNVMNKDDTDESPAQKMLEAEPDDIALVLHTSGTTGRPKAVPLTHKNLVTNMANIRDTYELTSTDRTMLIMPLFHVHGLLAGFLAPLLSRGCVVVETGLTGSFWNDYVEHKGTWWTATPTLHQLLVKQSLPEGSKPEVRFVRSCSSPLNRTLLEAMEAKFGCVVVEAYAMTEASHQMTSNPLPSQGKTKAGSVGRVHGQLEVQIVDDNGSEVSKGTKGEVAIRGESVTKGYLNNEGANKSSFTDSGFFRTGDQGTMDEDGYVTLTGRIKELINKGGEKISPIELDDIFSQHEAVDEAVSFAIPDELYGDEVGVAVVLKQGQELTEITFRRWVLQRLSAAKAPKKVFFTDQIPKTATGKMQRRKVAEKFL